MSEVLAQCLHSMPMVKSNFCSIVPGSTHFHVIQWKVRRAGGIFPLCHSPCSVGESNEGGPRHSCLIEHSKRNLCSVSQEKIKR